MRRRTFLGSSLAGGAIFGGGLTVNRKSALAKRRKDPVVNETGKYDLLLKGGHVIDPANNINRENTDVAVQGGTIAAVDRNIPENLAKKSIDVSDLYVTPGLVDIHEHVWHTTPTEHSVVADHHCFQDGVTTVLDPGSSGAGNFLDFKEIIDKSRVKIFALLNISYTGMDDGEQDPTQYKVEPLVAMAKDHPDIIKGVKIAHYWTTQPYDKIHTPWANVDAAVKAGRMLDLPVMFDWFPRPASGGYPARTYRELILEKSRPGDIHTHCYARHIPVLTKEGKVNPDIWKARERGFFFDVGHGGGSFVYRNAVPAIEQGYRPDSISTDRHAGSITRTGLSLPYVMSKFLCMGVSLQDVVRLSTINPAREINCSDRGSLTVGNTADIAVFEVLKEDFSFVDTSGGREYGDSMIRNVITVSSGRIAFDPFGLSFPYWRDVPKDDNYWVNQSGQFF